jgi:histidine triad (HIT) family protein
MTSCVFCDIVARRTPAELVYDDARVIAFLPLSMRARAHLLIAPRDHLAGIWDMDDRVLADVMVIVRELAARMRDRLGATGVNILHATGPDAQQSVPHAHVHLLARFAGDGVDAWPPLVEHVVDRAALARSLSS